LSKSQTDGLELKVPIYPTALGGNVRVGIASLKKSFCLKVNLKILPLHSGN